MSPRRPFTPFTVVWYCHDIMMDVLERCGLSVRDASVLEAGCGGGSMLFRLSDRAARVLGVDISAETIAFLREHYGPRYPNVEVRAADFCRFTAPQRFDLVVSTDCFEHVDDGRAFMRSAARALKPGGSLCLQFPNELHHGINHYRTLGDLRRVVRESFGEARYFEIVGTRYHRFLHRLFVAMRAAASPQLERVRRDVLNDPRTQGLDDFSRSACYIWMRREVDGGLRFQAARAVNGAFRLVHRLGHTHRIAELTQESDDCVVLDKRLVVVAQGPAAPAEHSDRYSVADAPAG